MEELVKEIMGDSYKEGLSKDELMNFFEQSVISSGKVVPLEKFTNVEKSFKASKNEVNNLSKQLEELNNSKLSADELKAKLEKEQVDTINTLKRELVKQKVEKVFASNGIAEEDYTGMIDSIVSIDEEASLKTAQNFVALLNKQVEAKSKNNLEEALKKAGKLPDGNGNNSGNTNSKAKDFVNSLLNSNVTDDRAVKANKLYFNK